MKKILIGIIAIILIGIMVIGFYNYDEGKKVEKGDSLDVLDEVTEIDGDVVVQFDREFYKLEDISLDYAKAKTLEDTVEFSYDLDGDLIKDNIRFYKKSDFVYAVKLNDVEVLVNEYEPEIYIVDLNESDNTLEVVLYDGGPSGDPHYTVYSKKGNSLESLYDKKGDSLKCDMKGTVLVDDSSFEDFSPLLYFEYMYINDGVVDNKEIDLYVPLNDVITNISTGTTPNVCITYPDHIATYLSGDNSVVPLDELFTDEKYGLSGSEVRFDAPTVAEIIPQFLEECEFAGHHYALPYMRSTECCYINKTYVEQLGYTVPDVLTWDFIWEVSDAAAKMDEEGNYLIYLLFQHRIYLNTDCETGCYYIVENHSDKNTKTENN